MLIAAALISVLATSPAPALSTCTFHGDGVRWSGSCGPLFDQQPRLQLAAAKAVTTGRWRKDVEPSAVYAGEMTDAGHANTPIELEIYSGGSGVLRTEYGWFPVSAFAASTATIQFQLDPTHEVPASGLDREIVQRADAILSSAAVWNRADNRKCPVRATSWSIYCAAERATIEVTGGFHHRRPAMELVRQIIEERTAGRRYHHRLMDYNNDPSTSLADVHAIFAEALARIDRSPQ